MIRNEVHKRYSKSEYSTVNKEKCGGGTMWGVGDVMMWQKITQIMA
jgi:hypothetical protein